MLLQILGFSNMADLNCQIEFADSARNIFVSDGKVRHIPTCTLKTTTESSGERGRKNIRRNGQYHMVRYT